jgi:hypothetical protein
MAETLPYLTSSWHEHPLYTCPQCGTSRFTVDRILRHMQILGHTAAPDGSPAPQATTLPASSEPAAVDDPTPAPVPEEV